MNMKEDQSVSSVLYASSLVLVAWSLFENKMVLVVIP